MKDSVFVNGVDEFEKRFQNLYDAVNIVKDATEKELNTLRSQLVINPIQLFEPLILENVRVYELENSNWYYNKKKISINLPSDKPRLGNVEVKEFPFTEEGLKSAMETIDKIAEADKQKHAENILRCNSNKETARQYHPC